jgi:hypothetical protein
MRSDPKRKTCNSDKNYKSEEQTKTAGCILTKSRKPKWKFRFFRYDYTNQVLLAGDLGSGAWTVNNPFGAIVTTTVPQTSDTTPDLPVGARPPVPVRPPLGEQ